jgi:hypothetical protein
MSPLNRSCGQARVPRHYSVVRGSRPTSLDLNLSADDRIPVNNCQLEVVSLTLYTNERNILSHIADYRPNRGANTRPFRQDNSHQAGTGIRRQLFECISWKPEWPNSKWMSFRMMT